MKAFRVGIFVLLGFLDQPHFQSYRCSFHLAFPCGQSPYTLCICIFALVLGYVLWKIDQGRTANEAVQLQELQTEMTEIENGFQMSSTPTP